MYKYCMPGYHNFENEVHKRNDSAQIIIDGI